MGESSPFDDFQISHGICERCRAEYDATQSVTIKGLALFNELFAAARQRSFASCRTLAEQALSQGWSPSDVAIGVLQPALYEIGRQWASGEITVAEEHQFTAWCEQTLAVLEGHAPDPPGPTRLLICPVEGNAHSLGARITALYARDIGVATRAMSKPLSVDETVALCAIEAPEVLGLSACLFEGIAFAREVAARVALLPRPPRVVLGGLAARMPEASDLERALTATDIGRYFTGAAVQPP